MRLQLNHLLLSTNQPYEARKAVDETIGKTRKESSSRYGSDASSPMPAPEAPILLLQLLWPSDGRVC